MITHNVCFYGENKKNIGMNTSLFQSLAVNILKLG